MIKTYIFYAIAGMTVLSSLGVVLLRNLFYSALSLGIFLIGVGGIFVLMGADFLFGAQILIYVGGILVLILFVVLMAGRSSDLLFKQVNEQWLSAVFISLIILWSMWKISGRFANILQETTEIKTTRAIADLMLNEYALPFELTSILIIVALIGAILFVKKDSSRRL